MSVVYGPVEQATEGVSIAGKCKRSQEVHGRQQDSVLDIGGKTLLWQKVVVTMDRMEKAFKKTSRGTSSRTENKTVFKMD